MKNLPMTVGVRTCNIIEGPISDEPPPRQGVVGAPVWFASLKDVVLSLLYFKGREALG